MGKNDAKAHARKFVTGWLESLALNPGARRAYSVETELRVYLEYCGMESGAAIEAASTCVPIVRKVMFDYVERWHSQGVATPFHFSADDEDLVITWEHSDYARVDGTVEPTGELYQVYTWLGKLKDKAFLVACACYLRSLGCNRIFITDDSGDEGVDCIGTIAAGPLQSTTFFVQAKSSPKPCSANEIRDEFGKYAGLPNTEIYLRYIRALGIEQSASGAAYVYLFASNADTFFGAASVAPKIGALIRSRRQLAVALHRSFSLDSLRRISGDARWPSGRDLARNVAPLITPDKAPTFI